MTDVIKRDGKKEAFDANKIRKAIEAAAKEAGVAQDRIVEVAKSVTEEMAEIAKEKGEIKAERIRQDVLNTLDGLEPAISEAWRAYDRTKKSRQD